MEVDTPVETIDINNLDVRKGKKRKNPNPSVSEVVSHNGIEGKIRTRPKPKKTKLVPYSESKENVRKIPVPSHRLTPLKENWMKIYTPITENLMLIMRFNTKSRNVEIKTQNATEDFSNLQKAADFVKAFIYGFEVEDALALIRLDDLFVETFEIKDVKTLNGDHKSRAIGRLAGKEGRTKFSIENATKTRIVLADSKIHILGSFQNIQFARKSICDLILGLPPSKVFGQMKNINSHVSARM
ncbi:RNA-binding protein pno1 [Coccinella septempunctata]|uniref:RNA-binding protein pno1 n=1 Tax=Coccinella septempunctata TaxID=41139 RepID=UPI001D08B6A3|nr:RNA-binding protein pno1 [Coccinella septempunctata]